MEHRVRAVTLAFLAALLLPFCGAAAGREPGFSLSMPDEVKSAFAEGGATATTYYVCSRTRPLIIDARGPLRLDLSVRFPMAPLDGKERATRRLGVYRDERWLSENHFQGLAADPAVAPSEISRPLLRQLDVPPGDHRYQVRTLDEWEIAYVGVSRGGAERPDLAAAPEAKSLAPAAPVRARGAAERDHTFAVEVNLMPLLLQPLVLGVAEGNVTFGWAFAKHLELTITPTTMFALGAEREPFSRLGGVGIGGLAGVRYTDRYVEGAYGGVGTGGSYWDGSGMYQVYLEAGQGFIFWHVLYVDLGLYFSLLYVIEPETTTFNALFGINLGVGAAF